MINIKRTIIIIFLCFVKSLDTDAQNVPQIKMTVGANVFIVNTFDNATAKAFLALLPITIRMNELNGNEKYYYLSDNLPTNSSVPGTINTGDIMLWGSNCLVLFYESFSSLYSYTKIGSIENPGELKQAVGTDNPTVKFELMLTSGIQNTNSGIDFYVDSENGIVHFTNVVDKIVLIDMSGNTIASTSKKNQLKIHSVSKGIYILTISNNESIRDFKVILK